MDVGALDAVVCCGYPGSVASIWQQWGRAGRGKDPALAVHPWPRLSRPVPLREPVEGARQEGGGGQVHDGEPYILGPHLLAAAHEAPLDADDEEYFGPAYRSVAKAMMEDRALASAEAGLSMSAGTTLRVTSLRSASSETVLIADVKES